MLELCGLMVWGSYSAFLKAITSISCLQNLMWQVVCELRLHEFVYFSVRFNEFPGPYILLSEWSSGM